MGSYRRILFKNEWVDTNWLTLTSSDKNMRYLQNEVPQVGEIK